MNGLNYTIDGESLLDIKAVEITVVLCRDCCSEVVNIILDLSRGDDE